MYERPSWFLAPVLDYDFDEEKLTGGLQARLQNINGMNQQLRVRAVGGARENASVSWQTPWIGRRRQSFGAELRVELPGDANDEFRTNLAGISTSRFLGDYKKVRQGVNANTRVEWIRRGATVLEPEVDEVSPVIGAGLFRDTRNVRVDPDRGIFASTALEYASSWTSDDTEYVRGQIDLRGFKTLFPRLVVAGRGQTILTSGTVPSYRDLVVGGAGSIRGQPSEVLRGTSIARSSVELRFKLLRSRRFGFTVPLLPEKVGQFTKPNTAPASGSGCSCRFSSLSAWSSRSMKKETPPSTSVRETSFEFLNRSAGAELECRELSPPRLGTGSPLRGELRREACVRCRISFSQAGRLWPSSRSPWGSGPPLPSPHRRCRWIRPRSSSAPSTKATRTSASSK
jgi:hypothetical protein